MQVQMEGQREDGLGRTEFEGRDFTSLTYSEGMPMEYDSPTQRYQLPK